MRLSNILDKNSYGYAKRKNTNYIKHPLVYSYSYGIVQDIRRNNIIVNEKYTAERVFKDMNSLDWVECDKFGDKLNDK